MPTPARSAGRISRSRPTVRIAAVWVLAAAVVLLFAHVTATGPVLVTLYGTHGVHLGDLVALLVASAVAAAVTVRLSRD